MRTRPAILTLFIGLLLIVIPATALGQDTTSDDSDQGFQVGDQVRIIIDVRRGEVGSITEIVNDSSGVTYYIVPKIPYEYEAKEMFVASDLEKVYPGEQFQGISDLIEFLRLFSLTPEEGRN